MPLTETLKPTMSAEETVGGGYVLDGASAFDGSLTTYSRVIAELNNQYAAQRLSGLPADTYPDGRTSVVLELDLARFGWTASDRCFVFFRSTPTGSWVNVAGYTFANLGTVLTPKTIDITAFAGSDPATGFEIEIQFLNDVAGDPPTPGG